MNLDCKSGSTRPFSSAKQPMRLPPHVQVAPDWPRNGENGLGELLDNPQWQKVRPRVQPQPVRM
jgi:hypothetical protein